MFRIPTLFGRVPRHQKFNYEPRFYDAQKEEREARFARLQSQESNQVEDTAENDLRSRMSGSFKSARKLAKSGSTGMSTTMMRLLINLLLVSLLIAWLQWGNAALYLLVPVAPIYAWFKFFKK